MAATFVQASSLINAAFPAGGEVTSGAITTTTGNTLVAIGSVRDFGGGVTINSFTGSGAGAFSSPGLQAASGGFARVGMAYKHGVTGASETVKITASSGIVYAAVCFVEVAGAANAAPSAAGGNAGTGGSTASGPAQTAPAGSIQIAAFTHEDSTKGTIGPDTGYTEFGESDDAESVLAGIYKESAGATETATFTHNRTDPWAVYSMVFDAASGGSTQNITAAGAIASAEAFGTSQLNFGLSAAGAIASAEAFGTAQLNFTISGAGNIASAEALGTPAVGSVIAAAGDIASAEAFGTAQLNFTISGAGNIASAEALGTLALGLVVTAEGIASLEAFGTGQLNFTISAAGAISSAEAFGTAVVTGGTQVVLDAGPDRTHVGAARIRVLDDSGKTRVITGSVRTRTR